jgi:glycosyltransferase involved in cell wall biosynthesis
VPTVSIITAVLAGRHQYLREAYASLCRQEMPAGWTWQWIVQEDGESGLPAAELPDDPRISSGTGRHRGAATARTLALGRASGVLLRTLDADDLLPDGALLRDITTLIEQPQVGWCVSGALDLLPDGSLLPGPRDPEPGPLPPGFLTEGQRNGALQVVGTTMCTYTDLVRVLGGWQALPADEDVALMLAAEAVADGWMIGEPGLLYRQWPGSSTADHTTHRHPVEEKARNAVLLDRAAALSATGWRFTPAPGALDHDAPTAAHLHR